MKENLLPTNVTIDQGNLGRRVIRNWDKIHLNVNLLMHGNWGLRISRHHAAEVYSPEEHRHAETNPTCEIHKSRRTSC